MDNHESFEEWCSRNTPSGRKLGNIEYHMEKKQSSRVFLKDLEALSHQKDKIFILEVSIVKKSEIRTYGDGTKKMFEAIAKDRNGDLLKMLFFSAALRCSEVFETVNVVVTFGYFLTIQLNSEIKAKDTNRNVEIEGLHRVRSLSNVANGKFINLHGILNNMEDPRIIDTKFGPKKIRNLEIVDVEDSNRAVPRFVKLTLWGNHVDISPSEGDHVKIKGVKKGEYRGEINLSGAKYTKITRISTGIKRKRIEEEFEKDDSPKENSEKKRKIDN